jgi:alpha-mannosidase
MKPYRTLGAAAALAMAALVLVAPSQAAAGVIQLDAAAARVHGTQARFLVLEGIGNICYWTNADDWLDWDVPVPAPGKYVVELRYSCQAGSEGSTFEVTLGDQRLQGTVASHTGTWYDHANMKLGQVTMSEAGARTLSLKPLSKPGVAVMNLVWIRLIPAAEYPAYEKAAAKRRAAIEAHANCPVYVVPNFHPASCGWLTDFSTERNYCANSYLAHLDRVRDDPAYAFALSEVNNVIAIMQFQPRRIAELRQRIREGRAELVNAFFLEPTINLSGGEALVKQGVEGLRWQRRVMGVRPRVAWMIDVTGVHEQMGQIVSGLGLDGMVYTRSNPTPKTLHWMESPDGSRCLGISPGAYADWGGVFSTAAPLDGAAVEGLAADAAGRTRWTPVGAPVLILAGSGDYSLPPACKQYPTELLAQWRQVAPARELRFTTLSKYLDAVVPGVKSGDIELPAARGGTRMTWPSFWIENPTVKTWYRRAEHALQSSEALAAIASTRGAYSYPVQPLYGAWLQMLLNMDRNTLWGAAGGMVFENARSWDVRDRFESVEATAAGTEEAALRALLGRGKAVGLFSPANWARKDPFVVKLPPGWRIAGAPCQADGEGRTLCRRDLPSMGAEGAELEHAAAPTPETMPLPAAIETACYSARIDPATGALFSLKLKPSGREMLGGPVLTVAEAGQDYHETPPRPQRKRLADSSQFKPEIAVMRGPVATVVSVRSAFLGGGQLRQTIHFHADNPRIDFETDLNDIPDRVVVVEEFPLAGDLAEVRRGIPYGFSHAAWAVPNPALHGYGDGIAPAIRWSHYQLAGGGGVALLDRGLPGRELNGRTPILFLLNAQPDYMGYPCAWLSGRGRHTFSYALVAHDGDFAEASIPHRAWEFNSPPVVVEGVANVGPRSFLRTSGNVILEAMRREGRDLELRMVECLGLPGTAQVDISLPHKRAALTNLLGEEPRSLRGGPRYEFPVRPQQIVTMRLRAEEPVAEVEPLLKWDSLVPAAKLAALRRWLPDNIGQPPSGPGLPEEAMPRLPADAARSLTLGRPATASNVYRGMGQYAADMAVDGEEYTRWATDDAVSQATLEVDLGKPELIGRVYLSEAYDRVRHFELQALRDGEWVTFARGERIGANLEMEVEPVLARKVRLSITDAPGGPTLWEFMLFPPGQ